MNADTQAAIDKLTLAVTTEAANVKAKLDSLNAQIAALAANQSDPAVAAAINQVADLVTSTFEADVA